MTALATVTAARASLGARSALLGLAVLAGQMSIGWANDAVDADRDRATGRRDKPVAVGEVGAGAVAHAAYLALAAVVPLSLALGWRPGATHLVAVGSAWLYDLRLKETRLSWLPYAVSFGLLPVIITTALPGHPLPRAAIVAATACLGVAGHFANTVGDSAEDAAAGVRGLPQRIGPAASTVVAPLFVAAAAGLLLGVVASALTVTATVVAVIAALAVPVTLRRRMPRHTAFVLVIVAAAILVCAFVWSGASRITGS